MMKRTGAFIPAVFACLFLLTVIPPCGADGRDAVGAAKEPLVFAFLVEPGPYEIGAILLADSIRTYGGGFAGAPIWVMVPWSVENLSGATRERLAELGVRLVPVETDAEAKDFPFAVKVAASAKVEKEAAGKYEVLALLNHDTLVLQEPKDLLLTESCALACVPVHHKLIGSAFDEPLDEFWTLVYEKCSVPADRVFPMVTPVDGVAIKPYFNAGLLAVRPERGLLRAWRDNFFGHYRDEDIAKFYERDQRYTIFIHQAILAGTMLSELTRDEISVLPPSYNYPLHLHGATASEKRAAVLNDLVTCRFDHPVYLIEFANWRETLAIEEPLKSWLADHLKYRGINVLMLLDNKFGAGFFMNRDVYEWFGWNTVLTSLSNPVEPCDFFGKPLDAPPLHPLFPPNRLSHIGTYQALSITPASAYFQEKPFQPIIDDERTLGLVKKAAEQGLAISTICAGARVLAAADIIRGKGIVTQPPLQAEIEAAGGIYLGTDRAPGIDGNIVTGVRDQYNSWVNCQALATVIENGQGRGDHLRALNEKLVYKANAGFEDDGIAWSAAYGGLGADGARAIIACDDGGYFAVGYTFSQGTGDADLLALKIDAAGDLVWQRRIGGAGSEYGLGCCAAEDCYMAVGYTTSYGSGSKDVYLVKLDRNGEVVFAKTYGGESWETGNAICADGEDGYYIAGQTNSLGAGEEDVYVLRVDASGEEIWSRAFGGERSEIGNAVLAHEEGGCVVGATTGTFGGGNCDFYLLRIDASGGEVWSKPLGSTMDSELANAKRSPFDWCTSLARSADGGFYLAGYSNSRDIMNVEVIKTDASGNLLWEKNFGRSTFYDYADALAATEDGGAIVCGTSKSLDGNNDIYVVKLDAEGEIAWEKAFGGAGSDWGSALCVRKDGSVVLAGHTRSAGNGGFDACVIRLEGRQE